MPKCKVVNLKIKRNFDILLPLAMLRGCPKILNHLMQYMKACITLFVFMCYAERAILAVFAGGVVIGVSGLDVSLSSVVKRETGLDKTASQLDGKDNQK
jgi:hypothetical protein